MGSWCTANHAHAPPTTSSSVDLVRMFFVPSVFFNCTWYILVGVLATVVWMWRTSATGSGPVNTIRSDGNTHWSHSGFRAKLEEASMCNEEQAFGMVMLMFCCRPVQSCTDGMHFTPVVHVEEGATNVATDSPWIRRQLSDSVYLWACGEKADDEDDDPKLSDRLIGWLILLIQGFAYTTLIVLAGSPSTSNTDISGESGYLLPSVTGAMYLLVASTTHDLRAGFSQLVDGSCAGQRAFGLCLLIVYGIMITAAMTVLVSTSYDSASVVLNAVTVLFIADLDEKVLKFLSTIPQNWRLFWAIESIGISFALALIAIFHIGRDSPLLEEDHVFLQPWPTWFIWFLNPAGVTLCAYVLSSTLEAVCDFFSEAWVSVEEPTVRAMATRTFVRLFDSIKRAKERVKGEPWFYAALTLWLAHAAPSWFSFIRGPGFPLAFHFARTTDGNQDGRIAITDSKLVFLYSNAILVTGIAAKALGVFQWRHEIGTAAPELRSSSGGDGHRESRWSSCADSRVPSLLVRWGAGYCVTSLLYLLVCSWQGSGCGWNSPPLVVTVIAYVVIPCFLLAGIFMVADTNILGTRFGAFVKPAVDIIRNMRRVEYWIFASVFRDILVLWIGYCELLDLKQYL